MPEFGLKQKAASSMMWTTIQKYSNVIVSLISGIILARLLTPYDYGCIGMLTIFITFATALVNTGFGSALIQKKRPTQEDYSTVFYWNESVSILMYIILFFSAPAIANFYHIPLLSDVLRVQGIILILNASASIHGNRLIKQFNFKKIAIISLIASLISVIVAVAMAYKGFGVWALVGQALSSGIVRNIAYWLTNKWKPSFLFSKKSFKELFNFGFYMFLSNIVNQLGNSLQTLLIGRLYNASLLGYYTKASHTEKLASSSFSDVIIQISYPLYAEVQDDMKAMISIIKKLTMTIAYLSFPILSLLMLLAKPLFVFLYSERWLPSVPYFQILCIAGIFMCLQSVNYQPIAAIGKSKVLLKWTIIKRIIGTTFTIGGLILWGIKGLLLGVLINNMFIYFANAALVSNYIGYHFMAQMKDLTPIFLLSLFSLACAFSLGHFLSLGLYVNAIIELLIFSIIYIGGSLFMKMESYLYFMSLLPLFLHKFKKHKNN